MSFCGRGERYFIVVGWLDGSWAHGIITSEARRRRSACSTPESTQPLQGPNPGQWRPSAFHASQPNLLCPSTGLDQIAAAGSWVGPVLWLARFATGTFGVGGWGARTMSQLDALLRDPGRDRVKWSSCRPTCKGREGSRTCSNFSTFSASHIPQSAVLVRFYLPCFSCFSVSVAIAYVSRNGVIRSGKASPELQGCW